MHRAIDDMQYAMRRMLHDKHIVLHECWDSEQSRLLITPPVPISKPQQGLKQSPFSIM